MNIAKRTVQGVFWTVVQNGGHRVISLLVFIILARLLTPEAFGLVALAGVFIAFMELFINIGLGDAIIQRRELVAAHLDTAFWAILAISGVATIGCITTARWFAHLFDQGDLTAVIQWLALSIPLAALTRVQAAVLQRDLNFKILAVRTLVASTTGGVGGVFLALNGFGVWSLVGQRLTEAAVGVLVLWTTSAWRPGLQFSKKHLRELFGFGVHVMGSNVMHFVNRQADRLIVGYFLGPLALGYYAVGQRLIQITQQVVSKTFISVLFPLFSKIQGDEMRMRAVFSTGAQFTALVAFPIFVFLAVAGRETVHVVFGARWLESALVIQLLSVAALLQSIIMLTEPMFQAKGRPSWAFQLAAARAVLGIGLFMVAVRWGIFGVSVAWVIRAALLAPVGLWLAVRLVNLDLVAYLRGLLGPFVGVLVMTVGVLLVRHTVGGAVADETALLIELVLAGVIYMIVVSLVQPSLLKRAVAMVRLALPVKWLEKT